MKLILAFRRHIQAKSSQKILNAKLKTRYVVNDQVVLMKKMTKMIKFRTKTTKMIRGLHQ